MSTVRTPTKAVIADSSCKSSSPRAVRTPDMHFTFLIVGADRFLPQSCRSNPLAIGTPGHVCDRARMSFADRCSRAVGIPDFDQVVVVSRDEPAAVGTP